MRLLIAILAATQLFAQAPRFESYKVPTPIPARREPAQIAYNFPDVDEQIIAAAKEGPDFAGNFVLEAIGCGSACETFVIVNVKSLKVYRARFNVAYAFCPETMDQKPITYKLDSKLLVINGRVETHDRKGQEVDSPCGKFYYLWDGFDLKRIYAALTPTR